MKVCNITSEKITDNDLRHIFDRFYRTDTSRNSETGGHGIGLSIAKAITEAHGGRICAVKKGEREFEVRVEIPI